MLIKKRTWASACCCYNSHAKCRMLFISHFVLARAQRTAKLPRNVTKCNFQTTGPEEHPSIPEADTVVERPNLVQNEQTRPSSCLKIACVCILLHLQASMKAKNAPPTLRIVRRKKRPRPSCSA